MGLSIQAEFPELRRTCAHLRHETLLQRRLQNIKVATIAKDGFLVVEPSEPLLPTRVYGSTSSSPHGLMVS